MNDMLDLIKDKVQVKYYIYLKANSFKTYISPMESTGKIPYHLLENKMFNIIDENEINGIKYYLINYLNEDICWITVDNPLIVLNSLTQEAFVVDNNDDDKINELFTLNPKFNLNGLYKKKYILEHKKKLYYGLEAEGEFIGFLPTHNLDLGTTEKIYFNFNENAIIWEDIYKLKQSHLDPEIFSNQLVTLKTFKTVGLSSFRYSSNNYWFNIKDTDIQVESIEDSHTQNDIEIYLEHLLESIKLESKCKLNTSSTLNSDKKLSYLEKRNEKLESRVELLEDKVSTINSKYKKLKNSKLGRIQMKYWNMRK